MTEDQLLEGFDPLGNTLEIAELPGDPTKPVVVNVLNSYTGFFDLFSELIQNALDATQIKSRADQNYAPKIHVEIDMRSRRVRVVDNGVGMSIDEFKYCLRPNISYKRGSRVRGNKGVGATYLAYGFSQLRIQTKKDGKSLSAILVGGRRWAEDHSDSVPRPTFRSEAFNVPELLGESSGTAFEVMLGNSPGERPRDLGWIGARNAAQWLSVLRIKTPLGGLYLTTSKFRAAVRVTVVDPEGSTTSEETENCEYYYPHEIPGKVQSLTDIKAAIAKVSGDANTKFSRLSSEFKKLDCMYEVWSKGQLLDEEGEFDSALDGEQDRVLIERHNVVVYGAFLSSARQWNAFNDGVLALRKGQKVMQGGLLLATDGMIQGDALVIPLTSAIGYQANAHIIVHFTDGNPDMGRKVFQPELKALAERLAVRAVTVFRRYLQHRKPDAGPPTILASRALHDWKRQQEAHADRHPLALELAEGRICLVSEPQQEQDVVALFHQLLAIRLLKGYRIFATSQSETYDSLYSLDYRSAGDVQYSREINPLGVSDRISDHSETEPKVLEYKFDFDSLVEDFEREVKTAEHIELVVCWSVGSEYKDRFYLKPLLVGDEGGERIQYGATHQAFSESSQDLRFEVIVLKDLLAYLQDPSAEVARQKIVYSDG